jgi:acyl-CoA synthetase (AMP-forming)/AMP-acid ligase II
MNQSKLPPEGIPVGLGFLPLHHTYGLYYYAFRVFLQPYTLVLLSQWDIEVALTAIPKYPHLMLHCHCMLTSFRRYKISQLPLIPSIVHQFVNHPNIKGIDLSSVRYIGSGAAYLPPDLAAKMVAIAPKGSVVSQGVSSYMNHNRSGYGPPTAPLP